MIGSLLMLLMCGALSNGKKIKNSLKCQPQPSGDPTCSDGGILVPASVSMSSTKKSKFGADKCVDGDLDTVSLIRFALFFNCFILLCDQLGVHHQEEAILHHHP